MIREMIVDEFRNIPKSALFLGLAGLLPFIWGVATMVVEPAANVTMQTLGPRFVGPFVGLNYGQLILAFMSGVLWGFATKAEGSRAATGYALSVLPVLWTFLIVGDGVVSSAMNLMFGYIGLLGLDYAFWSWNLTPTWWMSLRLILTGGVLLCLLPMVF